MIGMKKRGYRFRSPHFIGNVQNCGNGWAYPKTKYRLKEENLKWTLGEDCVN